MACISKKQGILRIYISQDCIPLVEEMTAFAYKVGYFINGCSVLESEVLRSHTPIPMSQLLYPNSHIPIPIFQFDAL